MAENEVVTLRTILPEVLVYLGWGLCLDVRDARAEGVPDHEKTLVSSRVPALIGDWTRCHQGDLELVRYRFAILHWRATG